MPSQKKRTKASDADSTGEKTKSRRHYFNDSGLDYEEYDRISCMECGANFEDSRIVWGGKPLSEFPVLCPQCTPTFPIGSVTDLEPPLTPLVMLKELGPEESRKIPDNWFVPADAEQFQSEYLVRIQGIARLASWGNLTAATLLYNIASAATLHLQNVARKRPSMLKTFATKAPNWPTFISKINKKGTCRNSQFNQWLSETLQIASESPWTGKWKSTSRASQSAVQLLSWLIENQAFLKLPPLSEKTVVHWFDEGWRYLVAFFRGHPEKDPYLRKIGIHRREHNRSTHAAATKEGNIRDGIKKQLRQSFLGISRKFYRVS